MKKILALLLAFLPILAQAQKRESEVRSNINTKIPSRGNRAEGLKAADVREALNDVVSYAAQRTPFLTMAQLRAGKADTAQVVQITDAGREGLFVFAPGSSAVDDSVTIINAGGRRYIRQTDIVRPKVFQHANSTYQLQKAINYAINNSLPLEVNQNYTITSVIIAGKLRMYGTGKITGRINITGNDVTIEGIEITNPSNVAVSAVGVKNLTLFGLNISKVRTAISLTNVQKSEVSYCKIDSAEWSGIRFNKNANGGCSELNLHHNRITNTVLIFQAGHGAIQMGADGGSGPHTNNVVSDNYIKNCGYVSIAGDGEYNGYYIRNNTIIQNNTGGNEAITAGPGTNAEIVNNYIYGLDTRNAFTTGILLYQRAKKAVIQGNYVYGVSNGIFFHVVDSTSNFADIEIKGNNIRKTNQAVLFYRNPGVTGNTSSNIVLSENNFSDYSTNSVNNSAGLDAKGFSNTANYTRGSAAYRTSAISDIANFRAQSGSIGSTERPYVFLHAGGIDAANTTSTTEIGTVVDAAYNKFAGIRTKHIGAYSNQYAVYLVAGYGSTVAEIAWASRNSTGVNYFQVGSTNGYNVNNIRFGDRYLWVDTKGQLRVKNSTPSSDTDGQTISFLTGSVTYDPPSIAAGAEVTTTVTVTGATLGQFARAAFSQDLGGITLFTYISTPGTATVIFRNNTAGAIDLPSGTLSVKTD